MVVRHEHPPRGAHLHLRGRGLRGWGGPQVSGTSFLLPLHQQCLGAGDPLLGFPSRIRLRHDPCIRRKVCLKPLKKELLSDPEPGSLEVILPSFRHQGTRCSGNCIDADGQVSIHRWGCRGSGSNGLAWAPPGWVAPWIRPCCPDAPSSPSDHP